MNLIENPNQDIRWLISNYGFVLPENEELTGEEFANKISQVFDIQTVERNKIAYLMAKAWDCLYLKSYDGNIKVYSFQPEIPSDNFNPKPLEVKDYPNKVIIKD